MLQKGVYVDGHEREGVVAARAEYLKLQEELSQYKVTHRHHDDERDLLTETQDRIVRSKASHSGAGPAR